jgi:Tfp pilus assembly protein PilZ
MNSEKVEKRSCRRFSIPGATISLKTKKFFSRSSHYCEDSCPVLDLSRGGLRFTCRRLLSVTSKVSLNLDIPEESSTLHLKGQVRWAIPNPGRNYKYQVGIQFLPYGSNKKHNDPLVLEKIKELEKIFVSTPNLHYS